MNDIEILERLENIQETFIEEGLQGYEMVIVNTKNLINKLIARNKELEELLEEKTIRVGFENKEDYIPKSKIKEVLDITATVLGDKYELDYQDIQDVIAETISKIKQELLQ